MTNPATTHPIEAHEFVQGVLPAQPAEQRDDYGAPNQHCDECRKHGICPYHRDIDASERRAREKRYLDELFPLVPEATQDAPSDYGCAEKDCDPGMLTKRLEDELARVKEAQDAPPERVWMQRFRRPVTWSTFKTTEIDNEYILASTAESLAEALRGVSRYAFVGWGECWCDKPPFSANIVDHQTACTAARAALARWEGKGQS